MEQKISKKENYSDFPLFVFHQGRNFKAQEFLGAHKVEKNKYVFRVWAPHAKAVFVIGDFNDWDENASQMYSLNEGGVWECYVEGVKNFDSYKFLIHGSDGFKHYKADPYAIHAETRPSTASKIFEGSYKWRDKGWLKKRKETSVYKSPVNIYEVHLGS